MKIAIVSQPLEGIEPPVDGGSSIPILTHNFATLLAGRGHDVTVYATAINLAQKKRLKDINEKIDYSLVLTQPRSWFFRGVMWVVRHVFPIVRPRLPFIGSLLYNPVYAIRVALDVRRRGAEIAHIHNFSQYAPIIKVICPTTKVVLHMHCLWLANFPHKIMLDRIKRCDEVLCCSNFIRDSARKALPDHAKRMQTIYNGVDTDRFDGRLAAAEGQDVYFIGRVSPEKGVHILIDAFKWVLQEVPSAQLFIIGSLRPLPKFIYETLGDDPILERYAAPFYAGSKHPPYLQMLRDEVVQHLDGHVHFLGPCSHSDIVERLRSAALLVQPSLCGEAFGMPVAEAMAMGLPVVVTRAGGLAEIVEDQKTGIIVERGRAEALAAAIAGLLRAPERRRMMGTAARRRVVERFAFPVVVAQLEQHYEALLDRRDR